jgi:HK97 family phage major capsid protein
VLILRHVFNLMELAMSLTELQEKRGRLVTQAREALEEIKSNTDESRAAELEARHDTIMGEFDKVERNIERERKVADAEARAKESEERARAERRPGSDAAASGADAGEAPSYRDAFHAYIRAEGQMGELSAEERSVLRAGYQNVETRAQTTTAAAGGYTVPTELLNILVKSMAAWGPMYDENVATVITTNGGGQLTMPTVNDVAKSSTVVAHTQGTTLTDDGGADAEFGQKTLDAFAFNTEWLRVSKELADDSIFAMETLLGDLLGERLGRIANAQLTVGTGSSAPNGIVTASTKGVDAAAVAAITADEIIDLIHSVDPAYRVGPKVGFMFNDTVLKLIRKLKDGDGNYLWQMGNVQQGVPGSLLGYNYYINQSVVNPAASAKSMLFGDFGKYYVRKVGAPLIGALQDKDFWPGFGVAGYIRFDGELSDAAAVKHILQAAS